MAGKYILRHWSVGTRPVTDPFMAPESTPYPTLAGYRRLPGQDQSEEEPVITSSIMKADGRVITTYSGSTYTLEEPDPDYIQWMKDNGLTYDPINPIKFKKAFDKNLN